MFSLSVLALLCLRSVALVNAALYILEPFQGSTCQGGLPCNVSWVDDGEEPLLDAIKFARVELFENQRPIQDLSLVDVRNTSHLTFIPSPGEGPNSNNYYLAFTSTTIPYRGYSAYFGLCGMSGSFDSPLPAATSSVPIPQPINNSSTSSRTSTITVGTLSTSLSHPPLPTPSVTSSVSGFSTSTTQISSASLSTTSSASAPARSNGSSSRFPRPLPVLFLAIFSSFFFS